MDSYDLGGYKIPWKIDLYDQTYTGDIPVSLFHDNSGKGKSKKWNNEAVKNWNEMWVYEFSMSDLFSDGAEKTRAVPGNPLLPQTKCVQIAVHGILGDLREVERFGELLFQVTATAQVTRVGAHVCSCRPATPATITSIKWHFIDLHLSSAFSPWVLNFSQNFIY